MSIPYLLVANLNGPTLPELNQFRQRVSPASFERSPAHLTLVPRFYFSDQLDEFATVLQQHLRQAQFHPFSITIKGVYTSFPAKRHLVLNIVTQPELERLWQESLAFAVPRIQLAPGIHLHPRFLPHISLFKVRKPEEKEQYSAEADTSFAGTTLAVEGVEIWQLINECWQPALTVSF